MALLAPPRSWAGIALPAGLAAVAAAAMVLPWWRADRGAVLLGGDPVTLIRRGAAASDEVRGGRVVAGAVTELPPDVWTGVEVAGPWAVVVAASAGAALVAALLAGLGLRRLAAATVVGDRVVRWISADSVAVTGLRAGSPVGVVVRGVSETGVLGTDGSVWLRSDADPVGTVRRLDVVRLDGEQRIAATYLPVVTIQERPSRRSTSARSCRSAAAACATSRRPDGWSC